MSQHLKALDRANECRRRRAALKRQVLASEVLLSEILTEVTLPTWLEGEPIGRMLRWVPTWGPKRVRSLLAEHRINELREVGKLTYRQRRVLAVVVAKSEIQQAETSGRTAQPRGSGNNVGRIVGGRRSAVARRVA